ncbi:hypothetical protein CJ030_MR0G006816 [Morella rubra]|uniref:Uncharacterized protein n=1 Tax=Morella rubra TaxID=262757 RepID=A0A6A1UJN7_9ROSI|nr:hypothetical protein CJ030_MR0G006816 [Morella rubra]
MASSENLASIEAWPFRPAFADSWISDVFSRDTETLTRAIQKSISGANLDILQTDTVSPLLNLIKPDTAPTTPTVSGLSGGSEPETAPKRQRNPIPPAGGKVSKRKSRASKEVPDDLHHGRSGQLPADGAAGAARANPEARAQRPCSRFPGPGCLPTLDTSAFLLDHRQQQVMGSNSGTGSLTGVDGPGPLSFGPNMALADGGSVGLDFDTFPSFPTLESWKVM